MASFKSTIKEVDKTDLYFKKYTYKASIHVIGVFWISNCETMEEFNSSVSQRYEEWDTQKDRYPHGWYRAPLRLEEHDLFLIDELITLKQQSKGVDIRFRHEHETFSLYTNDESLVKLLINSGRSWLIEKANASPTGVKYFKKDPPAKYRTYMTDNKVADTFGDEMIDYLSRTPDVCASGAFYTWLHRRNIYGGRIWMCSSHYVDYDDDRNLMMMRLMFPDSIGKTYKLEKKP